MPALTLALGNPAGGAQQLIDLIRTTAGYKNTSLLCASLTVRGDDGNGAGIVYLGGSDVSSSNYGIALSAGDSRTYGGGAGWESTDLAKWVIGSTTGLEVDVDWSSE
jgi:hypothetical protein